MAPMNNALRLLAKYDHPDLSANSADLVELKKQGAIALKNCEITVEFTTEQTTILPPEHELYDIICQARADALSAMESGQVLLRSETLEEFHQRAASFQQRYDTLFGSVRHYFWKADRQTRDHLYPLVESCM